MKANEQWANTNDMEINISQKKSMFSHKNNETYSTYLNSKMSIILWQTVVECNSVFHYNTFHYI